MQHTHFSCVVEAKVIGASPSDVISFWGFLRCRSRTVPACVQAFRLRTGLLRVRPHDTVVVDAGCTVVAGLREYCTAFLSVLVATSWISDPKVGCILR